MDVLINHRHGAETRATDVVTHGNTGDMWYRLDHADGSRTLIPMDSIMLVSFRDDGADNSDKFRDAWRALNPKKADPLPDVGPELFADMLENDIRELKGANPNELALRLVEKGWVKS